jgi:hypothetical protein
MKFILFLSVVLLIGCSDKTTHLQEKDTKYQKFLNQKSDKKLDKELERYEK